MMRSFSSAVSGLQSHQSFMDVVANNIANVNTTGFKANRFQFKDSFSQVLKDASGAGGGVGSTNAQQIGLGVGIGSIDNLMNQGAVTATGNPLDMAINGDGFFRVTDTLGTFTNIEYTRAGNFTLDEAGNLTTQDGQYVVGFTVNPGPPVAPTATETAINIPATARTVNIDQNGLVTTVDSAGVVTNVAYLSLAKFPNGAGLERLANNRWAETPASGTPAEGTANTGGIGTVQNRALEFSNVDMAQEFSEMIKAQRGFQANSRTITTVDEMLNMLMSMKR